MHSGAAREEWRGHGAPRTCGGRSAGRMRDDVAASRLSRRRRHALVRRREAHPRPSAPPRRVHLTSAAPPSRRRWPLRLLRRRGHVCGGQPRGQHEHRRGRCEREQGSTDDKSVLDRRLRSPASSGGSAQLQPQPLSATEPPPAAPSCTACRWSAAVLPTDCVIVGCASLPRSYGATCVHAAVARTTKTRTTRHATWNEVMRSISCWARRRLPTTSARRSRPRWSWGPTAACCRPASSSTTARDRRAARCWP